MVSSLFIAYSRPAIEALKASGVSDTVIATVLCDVRAAAIAEERLRIETIAKDNHPSFPTWVQMRDAFREDALPSQDQTK